MDACTCKNRSFTMLIWARHYTGCPEIARWPEIGIPSPEPEQEQGYRPTPENMPEAFKKTP